MQRGQLAFRGNYDHRLNRLVTPDAIHESVRVVWRNGTVAVWREDAAAWTADRIYLLSDTGFRKRATASDPHVIVINEGEEWRIHPLYAGGCGCAPYPLKGISRERLLAADFSHYGD